MLENLVRKSLKVLTDNSPVILTGIGVVGTLATTVLAVKATPQALRDVWNEQANRLNPLTKTEVVKLAWRYYVPAAISGVVTIASIIGAQSIGSRRQAALVSLYTVSEKTIRELEAKTQEVVGEKKLTEIKDGIAKQRIEENPVQQNQLILGDGKQLCYDPLSGRYFESNMETIRKAVNDINLKCINEMYASLNDFYNLIGLASNDMGEEVGWTPDHSLEMSYSSHLTPGGKPCLALDYRSDPIRQFWKGF